MIPAPLTQNHLECLCDVLIAGPTAHLVGRTSRVRPDASLTYPPHRLRSRLQLCSSTSGGGVGRGSTPVEPGIPPAWRCMYEIQIPGHRALTAF